MTKRIFIADDSTMVRRFVREYLESHSGFEVCGEAADGLEAVESATKLKPDLIVLDLSMPRMNGLEAATAVHHALPDVPIILFTLYQDVVTERLTRSTGIGAVIPKTGHMSELFQEVRRLLSAATSAPPN